MKLNYSGQEQVKAPPAAVWAFRPTREGNTIVLALRTSQRPARAILAQRAETIQTRWDLPAAKWLRVFNPVSEGL